MNNLATLIIGGVLGVFAVVLSAFISYKTLSRSRSLLLAGINNAENDLMDDIRRIGIVALEQTSVGRELSIILKHEGLIESFYEKDTSVEQEREEEQASSQYTEDPLTEREWEILKLKVEGTPNHEIAQKLNIADATLRTRLANIFMKLSDSDLSRFEVTSELLKSKKKSE